MFASLLYLLVCFLIFFDFHLIFSLILIWHQHLLLFNSAYPFFTTISLASLSKWIHFSIVNSVQFSRTVMSDSLRPHGLQHARLPCPSPSPGACSNSSLLSQWCHPTISSSVVPFSSCLQSFPASGAFPMNQFFPSGGQSIGVKLQHQSFQWIFRTDFL